MCEILQIVIVLQLNSVNNVRKLFCPQTPTGALPLDPLVDFRPRPMGYSPHK